MLSLAEVFNAQTKYGTKGNTIVDGEVCSYEIYLLGCRRMLTDKTPIEYYSWDIRRQNDYTDNLIVSYVRNNLKAVSEFLDENGDLDQDALINRLRVDIVDFGILKQALEDDEVQEIQINDAKTIWVVKQGVTEAYTDNRGRPYQFVSDAELHATIDRLIYNPNGNTPRMTKTNPLINTRTAGKGYRLSGVDSTAITPDTRTGFEFPCTSITIRKYAPSAMTFKDFEMLGTLTEEMSDFLKACGRANIRLACVGPTSSGKTTLLNSICWEVDPELRIILIQNPTEIMIYDRDEDTCANKRNVLHWEAQDLQAEANNDPTTPTMANMIAHALRNTPDVIVPGEARTPDEFYQMNRALKTGHRVLSTWHAHDGADAIDRAATELATLGGSHSDHARGLVNSFDIIVTQERIGDGTRKVMKIEELTGKIIDGRAETRVLFEYVYSGFVERDKRRVTKIHGYFQQVNPISDKLKNAFYSVGFSKSEIENFLKKVEPVEGHSNLPSQIIPEKERISRLVELGLMHDSDPLVTKLL